MTALYTVTLLDSSGNPAALLDMTVMSTLRYERKLNDVSTAQFTIPLDDERADLIAKHTWFEVTRYPDEATRQFEGTYMVVVLDAFIDESGQSWLIASGVSLEFLLMQRIVDPRNDPLEAGGWSTKLAAPDTVMAELVNEQAGPLAVAHGLTPSQRVPDLTVAAVVGTGTAVPLRCAWDNLLETLQGLAAGDRMDFEIVRMSGMALEFRAATRGRDRTRTTNYPGSPFVLLRPETGTLRAPRFTQDWREEKTVVYLMGQGSGDNREFYGSMAANASETAYSYAAMVEDLREADDATEYIEQALQTLSDNRAKKTLTFEPDRASLVYRSLWDVGDLVTVQWLTEADMRVEGVTVEVTADGETITPTMRGRYEQ